MASAATGRNEAGLAQLGSGGSGDRLSFRMVLAILWRCVPLMHPVRWQVRTSFLQKTRQGPLGVLAGLRLVTTDFLVSVLGFAL